MMVWRCGFGEAPGIGRAEARARDCSEQNLTHSCCGPGSHSAVGPTTSPDRKVRLCHTSNVWTIHRSRTRVRQGLTGFAANVIVLPHL
ncbi:hypothetical protein K461DRAFT_4126 [Myriangium duriaei CBS 260.36]|uniref:Uncharacterized protein n=1 Tax=Myriangium duriaei CBS 260.36 TaxID=1168546 RepID=A0A9P4J813_9PEZI|nr:hypothetical protein K461DRAFT_4126 [Myriangium duriaei CBS 260.36]